MTTKVQIYNSKGNEQSSFLINDDLAYVGGRVHKGNKCYYKGVGVPYESHFQSEYPEDEYTWLEDSGVFYAGSLVQKHAFEGKYGIFLEKYQVYFPDCIGSCSIKEGPLVINSVTFEKSSVEVFDCIEIDVGDYPDQQFYYQLDYLCGRKSYLEDGGDPVKLTELLEYMIINDWNFLWDKSTIRDISADGRVTDVADLFISDHIMYKLGSIYSLLYSLHQLSKDQYMEFIKVNNLSHTSLASVVFNSVKLLSRYGVNTSELDPNNFNMNNYRRLVLDYIVSGKNCGFCSCDLFIDQGSSIKDRYVKQIEQSFYK